MSETKLLPCPFCGGKADLYCDEDDKGDLYFWVECLGCEAKIKDNWNPGNPKPIIDKWNTRPKCEDCYYNNDAMCAVLEIKTPELFEEIDLKDFYCAKFERKEG